MLYLANNFAKIPRTCSHGVEMIFKGMNDIKVVNLAKCEFGKAHVTYLGGQVGHG